MMTLTQKFVTTVLPKSWSQAIQAESQRWLLRCPACGDVRSIWDVGGVRFKARSTGKVVRIWCPQCGQTRTMPLEYQQSG